MNPPRSPAIPVITSLGLLFLFSLGASAQDAQEHQQSESGPPSPEEVAQMVSRLTGTPTEAVVYLGITLIDGTGGPPRENMSIVVNGDRISSVVPTSNLDESQLDNAEVINASGWYALPGLIDSHVHLATLPNREWAEAVMYRQIYAGVTTVRDMAGDARAVAELARLSRIKELPAPDIHFSALVAGPSFSDDPRTITSSLGYTPGEVPWIQAIREDTDMPLAIARSIGTHATGIKIYANLAGRSVRSIIAEACRVRIVSLSHKSV